MLWPGVWFFCFVFFSLIHLRGSVVTRGHSHLFLLIFLFIYSLCLSHPMHLGPIHIPSLWIHKELLFKKEKVYS